jgi:hypothetical protein
MSGCRCDTPQRFRITGEVWEYNTPDNRIIGPGEKAVRVRCACCGGKLGRIGSRFLTQCLKIPLEDIQNGRCLDESERRTVEVDLI